jgi:hypothetical protein
MCILTLVDTNITDRDEDLDNMMMCIFGNNVAFIDPELFFNIDPVLSDMVKFAYSIFHV